MTNISINTNSNAVDLEQAIRAMTQESTFKMTQEQEREYSLFQVQRRSQIGTEVAKGETILVPERLLQELRGGYLGLDGESAFGDLWYDGIFAVCHNAESLLTDGVGGGFAIPTYMITGLARAHECEDEDDVFDFASDIVIAYEIGMALKVDVPRFGCVVCESLSRRLDGLKVDRENRHRAARCG